MTETPTTSFAQPLEGEAGFSGELAAEVIRAEAPSDPIRQIPRATLNDLQSKKRAEREVAVEIPSPTGPKKVSFLFRAISRKDYDALIDQFPPTKVQLARGDQYDVDRFAPALLAEVCVDPKIDAAEWARFWKSPDWSPGELAGLFFTANGLCQTGFELVPTTAGD